MYHLFFDRSYVEKYADGGLAFALPVVDFEAQRVLAAGLELRRIAPQFAVAKLATVPKAHDQRGVDGLPFAAEGVGDEDVGMLGDVPFAAVLRREDQVPPVRCVFGDAERVVEQGLHQRPQQQFLVGAGQPVHAGEIEVGAVDSGFGDDAATSDLGQIADGGGDAESPEPE